jgi:hypothetical protein
LPQPEINKLAIAKQATIQQACSRRVMTMTTEFPESEFLLRLQS